MTALELVDGLCGFFALLAGSYFCAAAAPSGMMASFNGILSAAFFGAGNLFQVDPANWPCSLCDTRGPGRGLGSSIGSAVISAFGIRTAYLAFGIAAGVTSVVYLFVYQTFLKKYEQQRLQAKKSELAPGNLLIDPRSIVSLSLFRSGSSRRNRQSGYRSAPKLIFKISQPPSKPMDESHI